MEPVPAQILSFEEVNILGNILNHTFGKSSTKDKGYSVVHSLQGNILVLKFNSIVHFNDTDGLTTQKKEEERISSQMIDDKVRDIKSEFAELAERTLKVNKLKERDEVEPISMTSARKIAYYRRFITFEIS